MFEFLAGALAEGAEEATEEVAEVVEEAAASGPSWLQDAISKFGKTPLEAWITFAALAVLGIALLVIARSQKKWNAKVLAFGALSIALSFVLSCIRLFRMPNGGSVTPASMLPVMLFSAAGRPCEEAAEDLGPVLRDYHRRTGPGNLPYAGRCTVLGYSSVGKLCVQHHLPGTGHPDLHRAGVHDR